jgi:hypothetical protein
LIFWLKILGTIGIGSATLPILFVFLRKKNFGGEGYFLILLSLLYFLSNWTNFILYICFNTTSYVQFNLHVIFEFIIFLFLYSYFLFNNRTRKIFYCLSGVVGVFTLCYYIIEGINIETPLIKVFSKIVLLLLSLYYFWKIIEQSNQINLFKLDFFWINFSILFYSITSFVIFLFEHEIVYVSQNSLFYLWFINQFSSIIYYLTFSFGIWQIRK